MTQAQEKAIEKVRQLVNKECDFLNEETKLFQVKEYPTFISLFVEFGMPNDNETAAIWTRSRAHLFIGPRGGVTFPVFDKNGKQISRRFHWVTILEPVTEQKQYHY